MPANLTAQYRKAEEDYRRATTPEEELQCLQVMLRELPKHKGTDKLQADLKQKISRLKKEIQVHNESGKRKGYGVRIPRQGAGTTIVIGGPNAGKSQLVRSLTNATPAVAQYPFTTHKPLPAMMPWEDIMVQLIDTPPITADYLEPFMQGLIRGADLVLLLASLSADDGIENCQEVLDRLNATKTRLARNGHLDRNDVGVSYTRTFLIPTMSDASQAAERLQLLHELCPLDFQEYVVSAHCGDGLEQLRTAIFGALEVVRVYTKLPAAKQPDFDRPYTIPRGHTLRDVAQLVHKDFADNLKFARVWGTHGHDGTTVKEDYMPHDQDVVELHL